MPTYDYICDSCNHEFEAYESIKADPQTVCPECRAATLRRLIGTGAAILFKGSGFYQTDYRSDSYKSAAKADDKAASPSTGGTNGTTANAKPADTAGTTGAATKSAGKATAKKAKS